jgi:hypothetical protein
VGQEDSLKDDQQRRAGVIRRTAVGLTLLALAFYLGFIIIWALK